MLDEAVCARMRIAEVAHTSIAALDALLQLLAETVDAATRLADVPVHGPTIEEEGAAARPDGTKPADPVVGNAAEDCRREVLELLARLLRSERSPATRRRMKMTRSSTAPRAARDVDATVVDASGQYNEESRRLLYLGRSLACSGGATSKPSTDSASPQAASRAFRIPAFVSQVALGGVGAVGARELSRLARNSLDWQKLMEVCRYVDTLLVDHDAVYDIRHGNDRLLLGMKGNLNEYELELLRVRALEAKTEKARRGEYYGKVAVGYRKTYDGIEKHPDARVQYAVRLIFDKMLEPGARARSCSGCASINSKSPRIGTTAAKCSGSRPGTGGCTRS